MRGGTKLLSKQQIPSRNTSDPLFDFLFCFEHFDSLHAKGAI